MSSSMKKTRNVTVCKSGAGKNACGGRRKNYLRVQLKFPAGITHLQFPQVIRGIFPAALRVNYP